MHMYLFMRGKAGQAAIECPAQLCASVGLTHAACRWMWQGRGLLPVLRRR